MSQPAVLTLSRTASLVGGLLWACLAPVFVYADSALDKPGTILIGTRNLSLALAHIIVGSPPETRGLTVVTDSLDAARQYTRWSGCT